MNGKPYVGVTGPTKVEEVEAIVGGFDNSNYSMTSLHIPMIGFLASYKTLNREPTQNRRYPKITELSELINVAHKKTFTMIHYNSREQQTLAEQLEKLFDGIYQDNLCRAVQLNIVYPDLYQLEVIKKRMPDLQIVFQASRRVLEENSLETISQKIKKYESFIDYVLIDPSGGKGKEFDLEKSVQVYGELKEKIPKATIGFAGGFIGENVIPRVTTLMKTIHNSDFCIDAEGGLRDKISDVYGDDLFNAKKVGKYIGAASMVLP